MLISELEVGTTERLAGRAERAVGHAWSIPPRTLKLQCLSEEDEIPYLSLRAPGAHNQLIIILSPNYLASTSQPKLNGALC